MFRKFLSASLLIIIFNLALTFSSAFAYDVVNNNSDGNGSLSWGIQQANQGGDNVINITSSVKNITLTREFTIEKNVTINGNGITFEGDYGRRLFRITSGRAIFSRITFMKGRAFSGNGGAVEIANDDASAEFKNCTFYDNRADNYGGAVSVTKGSEVNATTFKHCTIAGNLAQNGGGISLIEGGMNLFSSIILGNTASTDIYASSVETLRSRYNVTGSANVNMNTDNLVGQNLNNVLRNSLETVNDAKVFRLTRTSPAIDFVPENVNYTLSIDQTGNSRPKLSAYDAGAYEVIPVAIQSVDIHGMPYIQITKEDNFSADIYPEDASLNVKGYPPAGIVWVSSNPTVLTIDEYGHAKAVGIGSALITAEAHGWDENGNAIRKSANAYRVYVDQAARQDTKATISPIENIKINKRSYETITPTVKLDINGIELANTRGGVDYELTVSTNRLDIATAEIVSGDSVRIMAGENVGSCDVTVTARPIPTGEGMSEKFTVEVTENAPRDVGHSSGGGGCNSVFVGFAGILLILGGGKKFHVTE
ncbi:MAG: hypothetical protein IJU48_11725 [Synergistaceae bacterium]|nr:hypothetical protein [Synergistaceae bacterium]